MSRKGRPTVLAFFVFLCLGQGLAQLSLERVEDQSKADKQVEEDLERIRQTLDRLAKMTFSTQTKGEKRYL